MATHKTLYNILQHTTLYIIMQHTKHKQQSLLQQIELPAKLLDYFVWSNKSDMNQIGVAMMYGLCFVSFLFYLLLCVLWVALMQSLCFVSLCFVCCRDAASVFCEFVFCVLLWVLCVAMIVEFVFCEFLFVCCFVFCGLPWCRFSVLWVCVLYVVGVLCVVCWFDEEFMCYSDVECCNM